MNDQDRQNSTPSSNRSLQAPVRSIEVDSVHVPSAPSLVHWPGNQTIPSLGFPEMDTKPDQVSDHGKEASITGISAQSLGGSSTVTDQQQPLYREPLGIVFDGDVSDATGTLLNNSADASTTSRATGSFWEEPNLRRYRSTNSSIHQTYEAVSDREPLTPVTSTKHAGSFECAGKPTAPFVCRSRRNFYMGRCHWLSLTILILTIYSTAFSAIWLIVAAVRPRYGEMINTKAGSLSPINASTLAAAFAKTIELSFVTVFVAFLGQVLSRRAFVRQSKGMTIAEMALKLWVTQPGSIITHWQSVHYKGNSLLGVVSFLAVVVVVFYTTASATIVAPKLKLGVSEQRTLYGSVVSSFGNPIYVRDNCQTPITPLMDYLNSGETCIEIEHAGQAFHNYMVYMSQWVDNNNSGHTSENLHDRTLPTAMLYDNTTVQGSWINIQNMTEVSAYYGRVVNNVTMAMPHAGIYAASKDSMNTIMQPQDFSGLGQFFLGASVPSPAVNVLCVGATEEELAPLVYSTWPAGVANPYNGSGWPSNYDIPIYPNWPNATPAIDDIFQFGENYGRRAPIFPKFPKPYNTILNTTDEYVDALYVLATAADNSSMLCSISVSLTTNCSTWYNASISGGSMLSHCEDPDDPFAYWTSYPNATNGFREKDWVNTAYSWATGVNLNGGLSDSDDSIARLLTQLIPETYALNSTLPSIAEALAVLSGCAILLSSIDAPLIHFWNYTDNILQFPQVQAFRASLSFQDYASGGDQNWQGVFYIVLALAFILNMICLLYFIRYGGLITDFVESQNLFALALNSPQSCHLAGSCGGGPEGEQLQTKWHVQVDNEHVFIQAEGTAAMSPETSPLAQSEFAYQDSPIMKSYSKLSQSKRRWL